MRPQTTVALLSARGSRTLGFGENFVLLTLKINFIYYDYSNDKKEKNHAGRYCCCLLKLGFYLYIVRLFSKDSA